MKRCADKGFGAVVIPAGYVSRRENLRDAPLAENGRRHGSRRCKGGGKRQAEEGEGAGHLESRITKDMRGLMRAEAYADGWRVVIPDHMWLSSFSDIRSPEVIEAIWLTLK
jgi:hypothetical protein